MPIAIHAILRVYSVAEPTAGTLTSKPVVVTLLSNAVQSVEKQQIGVISIYLADEGDTYLIRVADNGPGVPPEFQHKLFHPNFTTKSGGTGLGLAICRGIVEQYRGEIFYTSSEWGGACFNVRIPKMPVN